MTPEISISSQSTTEPVLPKVESASDRHSMSLAYKAYSIVEAFPDRIPNARELEEMTRAFGIEIVTMALSRILAQVTPNKYFVEQVESLMRQSGAWADGRVRYSDDMDWRKGAQEQTDLRFELCIIESVDPLTMGLKWADHVGHWQKWARRAGLTTDVIRTRKSNSLMANAELIRKELASQPHDRRIIATLGQGGAEFRLLLEQILRTSPEELDGVRAWINVSGLIRGASGAGLRRRRWWGRRTDEFDNLIRGWPSSMSRQLSPQNMRLKQEVDLVGLPMVCVSMVGMPTVQDVPLGMKRQFLKLTEGGPNDGLAYFHESIIRPGYIVPVPGMSHKSEASKLAPWFIATLQALTMRE